MAEMTGIEGPRWLASFAPRFLSLPSRTYVVTPDYGWLDTASYSAHVLCFDCRVV